MKTSRKCRQYENFLQETNFYSSNGEMFSSRLTLNSKTAFEFKITGSLPEGSNQSLCPEDK